MHHDHPLDAQPRTRLPTVSVPTRTPLWFLLLHPTRLLLNPSSHSPPDLTVRVPHQAFKGMLVSLKTVPSHPRPLRRPLPRIAHPAHAQIGRGNIRGLSRSRWCSHDGRCRCRMGRRSHHQSHPNSRSRSGSGSRDFLPVIVGISSLPSSPAFAPHTSWTIFVPRFVPLWYMLHPPHSLISISYPRIPNSCVKYPHRPVCRRTLDLSPPGLALPLSPSLFASAHALPSSLALASCGIDRESLPHPVRVTAHLRIRHDLPPAGSPAWSYFATAQMFLPPSLTHVPH